MADLEGDAGIPKASIGNYKGVMLCNRPNEFGQVQKPERQGKAPFISRVDPKPQLGLNPTKKIINVPKKKKDHNNILNRHKKYLKMLQEKKMIEKLEKENEDTQKQETFKKFKEKTAKQRQKIKKLKEEKEKTQSPQKDTYQSPQQKTKKEESPAQVEAPKEENRNIGRLTEENLKKNDEHYSQKNKPKKTNKKMPAWAKTEEQLKKEEEDEIDDLIEFAYDLDYEKYMEDLEVRQALALIK